MKKKQPIHPRLYTQFEICDNMIELYYFDNNFDSSGQRILSSESRKSDFKIHYLDSILRDINEEEFKKLIKYIKIQKKALEKHQKSGNYNACQVVKESILLMKKFKSDFENWFNNKI